MLQYLIRRVLWAVVLFLCVTVVTYVIFFVIPANPAQLAAGKAATPQKIDEVEHFLGWRIQRHQQRGSTRRYVYTYPSKRPSRSSRQRCGR